MTLTAVNKQLQRWRNNRYHSMFTPGVNVSTIIFCLRVRVMIRIKVAVNVRANSKMQAESNACNAYLPVSRTENDT